MSLQRYEWEDALIDAQTQGLIPNGALLVALKLARAINWKPRGGKPAGLYWKNEEALKAVGASRTTYFDHRQSLFDSGFFKEEAGNLIPSIPESVVRTGEESQVETDTPEKSVVRTAESVVRTEKSVVRNPFSEDTCSEDVLSVKETVSDEPVEPEIREVRGTDSLALLTTESTTVDQPLTVVEPLDPAPVYGCGYQGDNLGRHIANHMRLGHARPTDMAKHCPIKKERSIA